MNSRKASKSLQLLRSDKVPLIIALILLLVVLSALSPYFFTVKNFETVSRQVSINAIVSVGMALVVITGGIDLSVGSIIALSSCVIASCMAKYGLSPFESVLCGILTGTLIGFGNGCLVAKVKIPPFIATLSTMIIIRGVSYVYTNAYPVSGLPESFKQIGSGTILYIPIPLLLTVLVILGGIVLMSRTILGNHIYAVGNSQESSRLAGINIDKTLIWVYTLSGFMCSIAAVILTSRLASGQPTVANGAELDAIAAVVLGGIALSGGVGTLTGVLFGALIIGFIHNGMNLLNVSAYYQLIVKGGVILLAIGINSLRYRSR